MKRLFLTLGFMISALLVSPTPVQSSQADEPVCFADKYGVRRHSPGAWPSWTLNMSGFKGKKCWYPSDNNHDKRWGYVSKHKIHKETTNLKRDLNQAELINYRTASLELPSQDSKPIRIIYPKLDTFDARFSAVYSPKYIYVGLGF